MLKVPEASGEHPSGAEESGEIASVTPWGAGMARTVPKRARYAAYFMFGGICTRRIGREGTFGTTQQDFFAERRCGRLLRTKEQVLLFVVYPVTGD